MPTAQDAPIVAALASLGGDALLAFIAAQRWFGGKGAAPARARLADVIVLPWSHGHFAIARVVVTMDAVDITYQVPLAARASLPEGVPERAVVGTSHDDAALTVYDAVHDAEFRAGLARALAGREEARAGASRWTIDSFATDWLTDAASIETTVVGAEQSNTSIVIEDRAILKLFRTLAPGVHPDVEVTQFLTTRAGFTNTPRLLATIQFDDDGERTTAGMLQEFLPGASDAWSHAHERGRPYFTAPPAREAPNAFVSDAKRLGEVTRAMHDALASDDDDPAFAPEPVAPEDLERWAHRAQQSIRESLALLERQIPSPDFPRDRVAEAQALVRRRDHYVGWIDEIVDDVGDDVDEGMRIRVHGDYHLGQVLHTANDDYMIIDFEGEPSKPLAERREKTSPLRDVAGMLRSIAYAAARLATSVEKAIDISTRELRGARWERDVRQAFVAGYLGGHHEDSPELFPQDERHVRQLIALFETEKAFYELSYELNNRPSWVGIPMRGIAKLFVTR
jgi:maltose alpha-D-glucosyltransferase/alpha-amylase